jgi:hypothetical protein
MKNKTIIKSLRRATTHSTTLKILTKRLKLNVPINREKIDTMKKSISGNVVGGLTKNPTGTQPILTVVKRK